VAAVPVSDRLALVAFYGFNGAPVGVDILRRVDGPHPLALDHVVVLVGHSDHVAQDEPVAP
jgi:hypothetical protein